MKFKDYYKILELESSKVTVDEIKSAYRKQAKKYHPDVNVGNKLAEEKIKDVNEAYRILSNPTLKRKYDRTWNYQVGSKRKKANRKTSGEVAGEFFGMFFGNNEIKEEIAQSQIPPVKGENIETEINISIEDGFYGAEKKIVLKDIDGKDKTITLKLPQGVQNGERMRFIGQGKQGKHGGKNGDLYIKINIEDGKKFKLSNDDLYTVVPISPWEAALGTKAKVNSIDDTKTAIYIPNGIQSGETIDTLEALKYAKANGAVSLSIINVQGSAIAYESDYVLYTNAGPEIAVASTKAYTTQLAVLYLLVAKIAAVKNIWSESEVKYFLNNLMKVPELISAVLDNKVDIHKAARIILDADDLFMIGRGLDYSILREGSLKLKEVSYIHSESYAAGELKHGPIALITDKTPVVAVMTQEKLLLKELSNIREVKSRGAGIMIFAKESFVPVLKDEFNVIPLPNADDDFMTFPASVALQILAYFVSSDKGFDVDKPRNLAKVVTVE